MIKRLKNSIDSFALLLSYIFSADNIRAYAKFLSSSHFSKNQNDYV